MNTVRRDRPSGRLLILLTLLALWAGPALAQVTSCALLPMRTDLRPNVGGRPVEVGVGFAIADIRAVDDVGRSLVGDFVVSLDWIDPRLSGLAGCRFPVAEVWTPDIGPINAATLRPTALPPAVDRVEVGAGGFVRYTRRLTGAIVTGHRLDRFPFDRHDFVIRLGARDDGPETILLSPAEDRSLRAERLSVAGWSFGQLLIAGRVEPVPGFGPRSVIEATLGAERAPFVPLVRFAAPMLALVVLSWASFWMPPERFDVALGLGAALLVALLVLQVAVAAETLRPGYLTVMDRLALWATLAILLALVQAAVAGALYARGAEDAADRIARIARVLVPLGFVAGCAAILSF